MSVNGVSGRMLGAPDRNHEKVDGTNHADQTLRGDLVLPVDHIQAGVPSRQSVASTRCNLWTQRIDANDAPLPNDSGFMIFDRLYGVELDVRVQCVARDLQAFTDLVW